MGRWGWWFRLRICIIDDAWIMLNTVKAWFCCDDTTKAPIKSARSRRASSQEHKTVMRARRIAIRLLIQHLVRSLKGEISVRLFIWQSNMAEETREMRSLIQKMVMRAHGTAIRLL